MLASLPQLVRLVKILRVFEEKEIIEDGIDFENFDDDNFESIGDDLEFSKIILRDILYYVYNIVMYICTSDQGFSWIFIILIFGELDQKTKYPLM